MINKVVENYLLQEPIGKGVYGEVYRAINKKTRLVFAVKVIPKSMFKANPRLEQLAINEINILSALRNESIVRFVETLKTSNNFYFVYQYCNGGTLETVLQTRKLLPEKEALLIFRQLLEAFKELNKNNIMHRDLKPDNIFISDGRIKLGDFGFCKMLESNMAQTMLGSPLYMAPQILKEEIYTLKADIWSLGVVLFQMLFGFCPFESASISELISNIETNQFRLPSAPSISQATSQLLLKMLKKDQFKRIEWVELFELTIDDQGTIIVSTHKTSLDAIQHFFFSDNKSLQKSLAFKRAYSNFPPEVNLNQINRSQPLSPAKSTSYNKPLPQQAERINKNVPFVNQVTANVKSHQTSPNKSYQHQPVKTYVVETKKVQETNSSIKFNKKSNKHVYHQFNDSKTTTSSNQQPKMYSEINSKKKQVQVQNNFIKNQDKINKEKNDARQKVYKQLNKYEPFEADFTLKVLKSEQFQPKQKYIQKQYSYRSNIKNNENEENPKQVIHFPYEQYSSFKAEVNPANQEYSYKSSQLDSKVGHSQIVPVSKGEVITNDFKDHHNRWVRMVELMQELGKEDAHELFVQLLGVSVLKQVNDAYLAYPEWTDVLVEERNSLTEALSVFQADLNIDLQAKKPALLRLYDKAHEKDLLSKAIRCMYNCEYSTNQIELILLT